MADYSARFQQQIPTNQRGRRPEGFRIARDAIYQILPAVFERTIGESTCVRHESLARRLQANDSVISFNYDCLIDDAIIKWQGNYWDPRVSYGLNLAPDYQVPDRWQTSPTPGRVPPNKVKLLKLHGSLNWRKNGERMELKTNPYSGSARHSIIPPTWFKQIDEEPYKRIWGQARQELREATALVVIGYSMPPSDFFSRYLFEQETAENLGVLVVANPDRDARSRIIGSLRNSVGNRTQIIELDGLEEFADGLR